MGIRFLCPNGHKLNVKSDLAGKRAICPDCGAKLVVPAVGMSPSESSLQNIRAASRSAIAAASPTASPIPTASAATEQPIVWYVRPASGGQFGPLSADELSAWIADQRVMADTYLWRPGWADWRMAGDAPPDLPAQLPPTKILTDPVVAPTNIPLVAESPASAQELVAQDTNSFAPKPELRVLNPSTAAAAPTPVLAEDLPVLPAASIRRRRQQTPIIVTILLVFTIVLLVGALIWVIRRNGGSAAIGPQTQRFPIAAPSERS
jgi:GYF domain 2